VVGLSQTISGIFEVPIDTIYEVQVRAKSDEFVSGWSPSGTAIGAGYLALPNRFTPGQKRDSRCNLPLISTLRSPNVFEATVTDTQATLSWRSDPRNILRKVSGYCIWRAENAHGNPRLLAFVPAQRSHYRGIEYYVDNDLLSSSEYIYRIRTVNDQGMSRGTNSTGFVTGAELAGMSASATRTAVTLRWDDPEDDTITGYRILRRVNWGTETTLTTSVGASATSYVDRSVSPDTAYAYRVQVVRGTQAGDPSPWVMALTLPRSPGSSSSVSERANQDLPADTTTTGLLKLDQSVTGVITSATDADWFAVDLAASEKYFFRLSYDGERVDGNGALAIGGIRDAEGTYLDYRSSLVYCCYQSSGAFIPERTGRYYVPVVLNYHNYEPFYAPLPLAYTLELHSDQVNEFIGLPHIARTNQAKVGRWTSGTFHDLDWGDDYRMELCGGHRYRLPLFYNLTADADGAVRRPFFASSEQGGLLSSSPYTEPYIVYAPRTGVYVLSLLRDSKNGYPEESVYSNDGRMERDSTVLGGGAYRFYVEPLDEGEDTSGLQAISEAPDSDLPANTGTAGLLPYDRAVTGSIGVAGDVDWFAVRFNERGCNRIHQFDLKGVDTGDGTLEDPYIVGLYDGLGQFISYNSYPGPWDTPDDNSGVGRNARQRYVPPVPGVYYVAVRANGTGTGTYTLTLRDITDTSISEEDGVDYSGFAQLGNGPDSRLGHLAPGIPATGVIDANETFGLGFDKTDLWHLNALQGRRYRVRVEGEAPLSYPQLLLSAIYLSSTDSDIGTHQLHVVTDLVTNIRTIEFQSTIYTVGYELLNPELSEQLDYQSVAWHALVESSSSLDARRGYGAYTVSLMDITDTEDQAELGGPHTTGGVAVGNSVAGTINVKGDVDWFKVDLEVGKAYRFSMRGAGSEGGTLTDPYMKLYRSSGPGIYNDFASSSTLELLGNNDACTLSKDSVLNFTADEAGPYWIEANTPGTGTGTYTIEVEEYDGANTLATGTPTVTGAPQAGETLTVATATICDADGLGTVIKRGLFGFEAVEERQFSYQWRADGTAISGATGTTYTPVAADVGKAISVTVSFTDNAGHRESLTSQATTAVTAAQNAPGNNPAEGAPAVSGTARVGETLTADTSGISDADGLDNATFAYQWLRGSSAIQGATAQTYAVADGDLGFLLSVRVTFTDDAGNLESLTGEPTAAVIHPPLTLESATVDGVSLKLTYSYLLNEQADPSETAFTVTVNGTAVTVSDVSVSGSAMTLTLGSAVAAGDTVTVGYEQPTGGDVNQVVRDKLGRPAESFSGRAVSHETAPPGISASASNAPASHDGSALFTFELRFSEEPSLSYVTLRDHAFTETGGSVQNARRLTPGSNVGWEITVEPSGDGTVTLTLPATTDCEAQGAVCTSDGKKLSAEFQLAVPGPGNQQEAQENSPATGSPTISGTAQVGETLTVATTGIADADGLSNVSYTYSWLADDAEISGATGSTYTLVASDQGKAIKARVSFTDDAGNAESLTSAATAAVAARPNQAATGSPTISGTAQVGQTLTASTTDIADADGLTNVIYTYQWLADDAVISGAMGSTYTLAAAEQGKAIKVRVSFTDDAGNAETLTSVATLAVTAANNPATGSPTISGTAQVGQTLTVSTTGIADADGLTNVSYTYQWLADDAVISGATGSSYTLVAGDQGKAIKARVSFTDDAGNAESLTSTATAAVAPPPLTASVDEVPASHDGSSSFTFELYFSEQFDLSYVTLRDHAFTVTGGSVQNARRLTRGSNLGWEITVEPSGDGTVTVELPITTDCAATGAICANDGRKLSNRLDFTVSGPG